MTQNIRKIGRPVDWCECDHPSHFDSGRDEHTYGAHVEAVARLKNGKHVCQHCAEKH